MKIDNNNPYVGLRPFEMDESILFFGRAEQTLELLQHLHQHHFVAVVGSSGSGKSSLLRAGLIPALKAGYLVDDSDHWLIAIMKPGQSPLYNLAEALLLQTNSSTTDTDITSFVESIREEGAEAILKVIKPITETQHVNFFLLVDQFEELFRFSMESTDAGKKDEAIDFVNILLELSSYKEWPVYVVFTMRSDFIGDCSQFYGLPEALNQSQYLVPRLTRVQLKNVIEGPAKLYGGKISPVLTSHLLNDVQTVKDELPLLQHVLMRTWDYEIKTDKSGEIDLHDYQSIGGIENALSVHADEALAGLSDEEKNIARLMFQALTTSDQGGRKIRRPAHVSELVKVTGVTDNTLYKIIDHFNDDKRSFLIVNRSGNKKDPLIDISHESLIRQWATLNNWADQETESAKIYLRLSEAATLNKEGKKDFISGTELQLALAWRKEHTPNSTWAGRYNNSFSETMLFLEKSNEEEEKKIKLEAEKDRKAFESSKELEEKSRNLRRTKRVMVVISILCLITIGAVIFALNQRIEAEKQRAEVFIKQQEIEKAAKLDSERVQTANEKGISTVLALDSLKGKLKASDQEKIMQIQAKLIGEIIFTIDVFYLQDIASETKPRANEIVAVLHKAFPNYIIRVKELSSEANAKSGYGITDNVIRCEADEAEIAKNMLAVIRGNKIFFRNQPRIQVINYRTPNYISIFICSND